MTQSLTKFSLLLLLAGWVTGCDWVQQPPKEVEGWKPIYGTSEQVRNIYSDLPQTMVNPGKIYLYNSYIFINDVGKGIHVVDNSNPSSPTKIAFLNIPTNVDMAVKNQVMYVDNGTDLVALDITDPTNISEIKRIENVLDAPEFPPYSGYFECYDPTKGVVIGWTQTMLESPECYR